MRVRNTVRGGRGEGCDKGTWLCGSKVQRRGNKRSEVERHEEHCVRVGSEGKYE